MCLHLTAFFFSDFCLASASPVYFPCRTLVTLATTADGFVLYHVSVKAAATKQSMPAVLSHIVVGTVLVLVCHVLFLFIVAISRDGHSRQEAERGAHRGIPADHEAVQ